MKKLFNTIFILVAFCVLPATAKKYVLVIDAGHGGKDAGAVGSMSKEKDINLKVALAFGKYVQKNCPDVNVIFTRKTDVFLELYERAEIANKNHADVFVSIHTNSLPAGHISRGAETYTMTLRRSEEKLSAAQRENSVITYEDNYEKHYAGFDSNSEEMIIMYEHIHDENMKMSVELAKCIQTNLCSAANRPNKGVKQDNFHVLRRTSMPACLVELGFISTPDEEAQLNNASVIDKMAFGIYQGFVKYKNKNQAQIDTDNDADKPVYAATQVEMVSGPVVAVAASVPSAKAMPKTKELRKANDGVTKNSAARTTPSQIAATNTQSAAVAKSEYNEEEEMIRLQKLKEIEKQYQQKRQVKQEVVVLAPQNTKEAAPVKQEVVKVEEKKPTEPIKTEDVAQAAPVATQQNPEIDPEQLKKQVVKEIFEIANVKQPEETKDVAAATKVTTAPTAAKAETSATATAAAVATTAATKDTTTVSMAPVFKVQLLTCSRMLKEGDNELKGLKDVTYYMDGNTYKFTIGEYVNIKDATELKKSIADKFPDSFVIAMQNGKRIDLNTALQWKK